MAYKKLLVLLILIAVIVAVVVELVFIKKLAIEKPPKRTPTPPPVSQQELPLGTQSLFDLPDGYVFTSSIQIAQSLPQSYILIAKLLNVTLQKDNSIFANISFATSQGTGKTITQAIIISPILNLTKQNTPRIFPVSDNMKTTIIKTPEETLKTLQNLKGKSILFTFLNQVPNPNAKTPQNGTDPQCNNAFLLTLSVNSEMPTCMPFTQKITIYENF